ncbi:transposase domain-containing protein [Lentzea tibetensis]|uniref:transposase domain-containing protein n=1 Tax=Lentzea tibetensis TaxID=2591470 RepID=UPI0038B3B481
MPRPGQVKPVTDARLSDRIAIGLLTGTFPSELVDEVIVGTGREGQRDRLLPLRVVVYFVLAMCLFSGQGYEEVARLLTGVCRGRGGGRGRGGCRPPLSILPLPASIPPRGASAGRWTGLRCCANRNTSSATPSST